MMEFKYSITHHYMFLKSAYMKILEYSRNKSIAKSESLGIKKG